MDKNAMKKMLAGLSIAGLVTGAGLTGCQQAGGSCGANGEKTENVEEGSAGAGAGSCSASIDTSAQGAVSGEAAQEAPQEASEEAASQGNGSCSASNDTTGGAEASE
ncbi:hypothetical protein CHL67_06450 [Prosthecochloris sp. GSB1]|nr:hypothetical protein CHL67_06450 [Prosthecochloris sp. GSB1]